MADIIDLEAYGSLPVHPHASYVSVYHGKRAYIDAM